MAQMESKEEKALKIKELATNGDFLQISTLYGGSSLLKGKSYASKKVAVLHDLLKTGKKVTNEKPFLLFAAQQVQTRDIADVAAEWKENIENSQDSLEMTQGLEPDSDQICHLLPLQIDFIDDLDKSDDFPNFAEVEYSFCDDTLNPSVLNDALGIHPIPITNNDIQSGSSRAVDISDESIRESNADLTRIQAAKPKKLNSKITTAKHGLAEPMPAKCAFSLFCDSTQDALKKDGINRSDAEVAAEVGSRWASATRVERQLWTNAAKSDHKRFADEMKKYSESIASDVDNGQAINMRKSANSKQCDDRHDGEENQDARMGDDELTQLQDLSELCATTKSKNKARLVTPLKRSMSSAAQPSLTTTNTQKKTKKQKLDPLAPKCPKNAYMYFSQSVRSDIASENPGLSLIQLAPKIAERWRALDEAEKEPFTRLADNDKARYLVEVKDYRAKVPLGAENTVRQKVSKAATPFQAPQSSQSKRAHSADSSGSKYQKCLKIPRANMTNDFAAEKDDNDSSDDSEVEQSQDSDVPAKLMPVSGIKQAYKRSASAKSMGHISTKRPFHAPAPIVQPVPVKKVSKSSGKPPIKHHIGCSPEATPKGIKQSHLPPQLDLLNVKTVRLSNCETERCYLIVFLHSKDIVLFVIPRTKGNIPSETIDAVGTQVVLILAPYREFLSMLPADLLAAEQMQAIQQVCGTIEQTMYATISTSSEVMTDKTHSALIGAGTLKLLTITPMKKSSGRSVQYSVLSLCTASSLLKSDVFLLPKEKYNSSLRAPFLHVGAQVRRLFAADEDPDDVGEGDRSSEPRVDGEWYEGNIYHIRNDIKTNPYQAVSVVWLTQERGTNDWLYSYTQTDCNNSPWDLEISQFVLAENMRPPIYPKAFRVGALTAEPIMNYLKSLDFAYPFLITMSKVSEFTDQFPNEEDHLDLVAITKLCGQGRYEGASGVGILTLFADLQRMVCNSKAFNECNSAFQPWRLADMMDKELLTMREVLASYHPSMSQLLERVEEAREAEVTLSQEEIQAV